MTNPSVLRKLESGFYKVVINNDKVYVPEREYNAHHVFLVGFSKAEINLYGSKVRGEIDYGFIPMIDFSDEVLSITSSKQPRIIHKYEEKLKIKDNMLKGESKPLSIRISEETEYIVSVNEKHVYKGDNIEVKFTGFNSVLNMLIYPLRIIWIYVPHGYINLSRGKNTVKIEVNEI